MKGGARHVPPGKYKIHFFMGRIYREQRALLYYCARAINIYVSHSKYNISVKTMNKGRRQFSSKSQHRSHKPCLLTGRPTNVPTAAVDIAEAVAMTEAVTVAEAAPVLTSSTVV